MDAFECIRTKLDVREFSAKPVSDEVKLKILEAARLTGSGVNSQHWRFILVQRPEGIAKLAGDSTTGRWVGGANFAVIVLTDPTRRFHEIDAGRALQDMQLAAWNYGVASAPYTGVKAEELRRDFGIPESLHPAVVIGFGHPARRLVGRKSRRPLSEIAYLEAYGKGLTFQKPSE
ncbi:MAG TPA: nitroreductase family protein [Nitrososphaerales archaeon]|nr:nitroreductase family protein [Nitrososphaerales archaeon]